MNRLAPDKGISDEAYLTIRARAYSFHVTTGIDQDELEGAGLECYVHCLKEWDSTRGVKFTTFLTTCLNHWLGRFCKNWWQQLPARTWDGEDFPDIPYHAEHLSLETKLGRLSDEARQIIRLIEDSEKITEKMNSRTRNQLAPRNVKGALKKVLREMGWQPRTIKQTFKELTRAVASL